MSSVSLEQGAVCVAQSSGLFNIVHKHWSRVYFEIQPFCHNFLCAGDCQTVMHIRINCRSGCDVELELVGSGDSILVLTVSQVLLLTTDLRSVVHPGHLCHSLAPRGRAGTFQVRRIRLLL